MTPKRLIHPSHMVYILAMAISVPKPIICGEPPMPPDMGVSKLGAGMTQATTTKVGEDATYETSGVAQRGSPRSLL